MKQVILAGVAATMALIGAARAADTISVNPDDVIAGRQAGFDLQGGNTEAMKAAIAGGGSVKPYAEGARGILAWSKVIPSQFPLGTETGHDTKAKPEIWSDRAGFEKAAANLTAQSDKLVALAEADDKAGFAAQYVEVGKACGACHRQYKNR